MSTIWKYEIGTGFTCIPMPKDARFLSVHSQHGQPVVWMIVEPSAPTELRYFTSFPTGGELPDEFKKAPFLGTFMLHDGRLVFHLFEGAPEQARAYFERQSKM
jgi:hypothetical protein